MFVSCRSFNDFLQQAARDKSDESYPKTLEDLSKAGIRLVIADANDPDNVPVSFSGAWCSMWLEKMVPY